MNIGLVQHIDERKMTDVNWKTNRLIVIYRHSKSHEATPILNLIFDRSARVFLEMIKTLRMTHSVNKQINEFSTKIRHKLKSFLKIAFGHGD